MSWLAAALPWIKALHIIAVIAWMAGLLYLPRLFVYHAQTPAGAAERETFKIMERRLLRALMNPAAAAVYLFGALLLLTPGLIDWSRGWIHLKLLLVAGLTLFHLGLARWRQDFARDANRHSVRFYRIMNEVPTLLMIGIVILVVVQPF